MLHLIGLINFIADLGLDNIWLKNELGFLLRMYKTGLSYLLTSIFLQTTLTKLLNSLLPLNWISTENGKKLNYVPISLVPINFYSFVS